MPLQSLLSSDFHPDIEYYKKMFGATETVRMNGPDGKVGHAELKIGNSHIMLADENPGMGQGHTSPVTTGGSSKQISLVQLFNGLNERFDVFDLLLAAECVANLKKASI